MSAPLPPQRPDSIPPASPTDNLPSPAADPPRIDYAWIVLGILLTMLMLNQGDRAFFGNVLKPLQDHFETNRTSLSLAVTFNTVISGLGQPIWGRVFNRYGPRAVIAPSSLLVALGFGLLTTATELWQMYLYFGLFAGVGLAGTSASIGFALGARWFRRRRAFAFGLLAAGGMAGSFLIVPGTMLLLLNIGWRGTFLTIAVLSILVAAPFILGLVPAGPKEPAVVPLASPLAPAPVGAAVAAAAEASVGIARAVRGRTFWLLAIPSWVSGFCGIMVQVHAVPMLTDRGFDEQLSANALGLVSGLGMLAVILAGVLAPRFGEQKVLAATYGCRAIGVILLAFTHSLPLLVLAVLFIGLSWGGVQPMVGGLIGDAFGRASLASVLGWIFMTQNVIGASAALLGGALFDLTGDYFIFILGTGVALIIGVPMSLAIRTPPRAPAPRPARV